jgi:hypothetical protein
MGIDINREKYHISQQGQGTDGSDELIVAKKLFQKNLETTRRKFDKINNHQPDQGADQTEKEA